MEKADRDTEITSRYLYERGRLISNDNRPSGQGSRRGKQQLIVALGKGTHYIVGYYPAIPPNCLKLPILIGQQSYRFP